MGGAGGVAGAPAAPRAGAAPRLAAPCGALGFGIVIVAYSTCEPGVTPAISNAPAPSAVAEGITTVAAQSCGATRSCAPAAGWPVMPFMARPRMWKDRTLPGDNEKSIPPVLTP